MKEASKKKVLRLVLLALLLPAVAGAQEKAAASKAQSPTVKAEPADGAAPFDVMTGAEVPSYFVIAAFLRRAQIVMERPLEQRPDNFKTFGCAPGDPRFEKCAELIKKGADVYAREIPADKVAAARQQELDVKAKETAQLYSELLKLIGQKPEAAAAFHQWVEEVRLTVGVGISDEPGNDLLQSARVFDQELAAAYPGYRQLPGFVPAPAKAKS